MNNYDNDGQLTHALFKSDGLSLLQRFRDIQTGDAEDKFNWMKSVDTSLHYRDFPVHVAAAGKVSNICIDYSIHLMIGYAGP